jgi:hypothetical protein
MVEGAHSCLSDGACRIAYDEYLMDTAQRQGDFITMLIQKEARLTEIERITPAKVSRRLLEGLALGQIARLAWSHALYPLLRLYWEILLSPLWGWGIKILA